MKKFILMLMLCAPMTMMAQKFGKVNTQQIMQSLPDVAKANGELEASRSRRRTTSSLCRMSSSARQMSTRRAQAQ